MAMKRFTAAQVSKALRENEWMVSQTAESLHCDWSTVWRYLKRYPSLEAVHDEARETLIDFF
jgi:transcriptional regulator of acetoin/glycerol metabolism